MFTKGHIPDAPSSLRHKNRNAKTAHAHGQIEARAGTPVTMHPQRTTLHAAESGRRHATGVTTVRAARHGNPDRTAIYTRFRNGHSPSPQSSCRKPVTPWGSSLAQVLSTVTMTTENSASCRGVPVPRLGRQTGSADAHQCTGYRADRVRRGQPWALGREGLASWGQNPLGTSQQPEGSGQELAPVLWPGRALRASLSFPGPRSRMYWGAPVPRYEWVVGGSGTARRVSGCGPRCVPSQHPCRHPSCSQLDSEVSVVSTARSEAKLLPANGPARAIAQVPGRLAPRRPAPTPSRDPGARATIQSNELEIEREEDACP